MRQGLVWVASEGGPLLLLDRGLSEYWTGVFTPGANPEEDPLEGTDYGRACAVEEYLGVVDVGPGRGVVLGDEPTATAWLPVSEGGGVLVRWVAAESEEDVVAALGDLESAEWEPAGVSLEVTSGELVLFDAACARGNCGPDSAGSVGSLVIELEPGMYTFETAEYGSDDDTELLLHRLSPRVA